MNNKFGQKILSGNAFSELGSMGTPLTTNGSAQYLFHLSVKSFFVFIDNIQGVTLGDFMVKNTNLFWKGICVVYNWESGK